MNKFDVQLPSRGLLNGGKLPEGRIQMKPWSSDEQSIVYDQGIEATSKFDRILENCLLTKEVPLRDMLMTDRLYMMVISRMRSFPNGGEYHVPVRCSSCRSQFTQVVNLAKDLFVKVYEDLPVNPADRDETTEYLGTEISEPRIYTLPMAQVDIEYRYLRGGDERQIANTAKRVVMQSVGTTDPSLALRLSLMITKIDGKEVSPEEKHLFVRQMTAGDTEAFQEEVEETESGIDMSFFYQCKSCGFEEEVGLPFTADFFRPRRRKSKRHRYGDI